MTLASRYGEDPTEYQNQERVSCRITPRRVFEYGAATDTPAASQPHRRTSIKIRAAEAADWSAIWPFMQQIVAAGETFSWDRDIPEEIARASWMHQPPGRTFVAIDPEHGIIGTAEMEPNHGGPGAHVATAGFMVDPRYQHRGAGRALCEHVLQQAPDDGYRAIQFNAVVQSNTRAVALWRALGFNTLAVTPDAFDHPRLGHANLLVMHRKL